MDHGWINRGWIDQPQPQPQSQPQPQPQKKTNTLIHEGDGASRRLHTGGGGRLRHPPPCVDSFMDECVAVAVAETVAVAVAEINPSTINPPAIWDRFGIHDRSNRLVNFVAACRDHKAQ